jgi:hypothetical protein
MRLEFNNNNPRSAALSSYLSNYLSACDENYTGKHPMHHCMIVAGTHSGEYTGLQFLLNQRPEPAEREVFAQVIAHADVSVNPNSNSTLSQHFIPCAVTQILEFSNFYAENPRFPDYFGANGSTKSKYLRSFVN